MRLQRDTARGAFDPLTFQKEETAVKLSRMDRRQVTFGIVGPGAGAGVALFLASLNPALAAFAEVTRIGGVACLALAGGIWLGLYLTAPGQPPGDRGYVRLVEVGMTLYRQAPDLREFIQSFVGDAFNDAAEGAVEYAQSGAIEAGVQIYGRRAPGLPLEIVPPEEVKRNAFDAVFDKHSAEWRDLSIRRGDVRKVIRFYTVEGSDSRARQVA